MTTKYQILTDYETQRVKDGLRWLVEHPGEWLHWAVNPHPASARQFRLPSFERRAVSHGSVHDGYGPYAGMEPGLWVRYVGGDWYAQHGDNNGGAKE